MILIWWGDDIGMWNCCPFFSRGMMDIARPTLIASKTKARLSPWLWLEERREECWEDARDGNDPLQVVLLGVAALSTIALFAVDLYG
jgi:hypothetical protein